MDTSVSNARAFDARRAVVTGLGIVSPIGIGVVDFWNSLQRGESGINYITSFDVSQLAPECRIGGEVRDFDPSEWIPKHLARSGGRFSHFALAAAKMAILDSDLTLTDIPNHRIMASFGTSMSGLVDVFLPAVSAFLRGEEMSPWAAREFPAQAATVHVANGIGAQGGGITLSTGCAAGVDAIAWAADQVRSGRADAVVAGATETPLSPATLDAFRLYGILSRWVGPPGMASRPFEFSRSGLVVSEGAAAVLVEDEERARRRGARIYAVLQGSGTTTEPLNGGRFEISGESAAYSMTQALKASDLKPSDIDHICAHGNSIPDHDLAETAAVKLAFGAHAASIPISSIKSMCGQAFAASGAMQVATTCLAIQNGLVPPTINYDVPDPKCDLDYVPNTARVVRLRHALVHVRSIGGTHVSLVLSRVA